MPVMIIRDCFRHETAASCLPSPFRLAITAVVPTHSAWASSSIIIRGCAQRPTDAIAAGPILPTIIVSNEFISVISSPSRAAGQAMVSSLLYISGMVSGSSSRSFAPFIPRKKSLRLFVSPIFIQPPCAVTYFNTIIAS